MFLVFFYGKKRIFPHIIYTAYVSNIFSYINNHSYRYCDWYLYDEK